MYLNQSLFGTAVALAYTYVTLYSIAILLVFCRRELTTEGAAVSKENIIVNETIVFNRPF